MNTDCQNLRHLYSQSNQHDSNDRTCRSATLLFFRFYVFFFAASEISHDLSRSFEAAAPESLRIAAERFPKLVCSGYVVWKVDIRRRLQDRIDTYQSLGETSNPRPRMKSLNHPARSAEAGRNISDFNGTDFPPHITGIINFITTTHGMPVARLHH